jgi:hypothetical protein
MLFAITCTEMSRAWGAVGANISALLQRQVLQLLGQTLILCAPFKHCACAVGTNTGALFQTRLELALQTLFMCAPFWRGGQKQINTRRVDGTFFSDGLRLPCGGGPDTQRRRWTPGSLEWYHSTGGRPLPVDPVAKQHALQQIDKLHMDWRALLGALLALLYGAQQRTYCQGWSFQGTNVMQHACLGCPSYECSQAFHTSISMPLLVMPMLGRTLTRTT